MTYYILPNIYPNLEINNIKIEFLYGIKDLTIISKSLKLYLSKIKTQINSCLNEWDIYKKYTNNYEYIHTIIPNTKISICKIIFAHIQAYHFCSNVKAKIHIKFIWFVFLDKIYVNTSPIL